MLQFFLGTTATAQTTSATIAGTGSLSASAFSEAFTSATLAGVGAIAAVATGSYTDTFTDTAGTALTAHTPDQGGSWANLAGAGAVITSGNRVRQSGTNAGTAIQYHSFGPTSADYDVSADITQISATTDQGAGVAGRIDPAANNAYMARYAQGSPGAIQLFRRVAGTYSSVLATSSFTATTGVAFRLTLRMTGSTIKVLKDSVEVISYSDATPVTGAGLAGIAHYATAVTPADGTGMQVDNFTGMSPGTTSTGSATIAGTGSLTAAVATTSFVSASVAGVGSVSAAASTVSFASASIAAVGNIVVIASGASVQDVYPDPFAATSAEAVGPFAASAVATSDPFAASSRYRGI